jgi:hypothetical protein
MFFVGIFGGGVKASHLGTSLPRNCPRCHNTQPWSVYETKRYFSFFFIPVATWGRHCHLSCPICGERTDLDSCEEAERLIRTGHEGSL